MSSAFCNRRHSVLAALGQVRGERVLDLGCGTGLCSRLLKAQGAGLVVGQDVSEGMLSYARAQEPAGHRGIEYVHALPPALEGTFDAVLGVYVLPYAEQYAELVALCGTAARALRPGGRFVTLPVDPDYDGRREQWRLLAEGAPDDATADYLTRYPPGGDGDCDGLPVSAVAGSAFLDAEADGPGGVVVGDPAPIAAGRGDGESLLPLGAQGGVGRGLAEGAAPLRSMPRGAVGEHREPVGDQGGALDEVVVVARVGRSGERHQADPFANRG
ncbi:Methyltransferase domain-containing protein [Streptomyces sp. TLI_053]|uniref:class I SAM-dependent methyltransferase n=1 Tax=Streptomyces sp. TLI_053 TaxID=1855352 RepID=UPI00087CA38A|nr:methyltransferase domain-containing protein [Streptomyces sp. TLI_053]SDT82432.1 Methyltransferase domain-containing protein [Streptomyces sp. TLI_053]